MRRTSVAMAIFPLALFSAFGASTQFYGVTLGHRYSQSSMDGPVALAAQGFEARAFLYATSQTTASVKKPNNSTVNLATAGSHLEFSAMYDTSGALNLAWPAGSYTVNIANATDGTKASTMTLASDFYPTPARVANFAEAQAMVAGQNFILTWDALNRPVNDLVEVRLEESGTVVFETPAYLGIPGALNGTLTSVTIPGDRLQEGRVYTCTITVWHGITRDTTTIAGALGETAYTAETILPMRTRFNVQDVRQYGIEKRVMYEQPNATAVLRTNPFEIGAFASAAAANSMTAAAFRSPAGTMNSLTAAGPEFGFTQAFATQAAMEAAFGTGVYEMQMTTKNNGSRSNSSTLTGGYPAGPAQVINIDEAQYIKTGAAFSLLWNSPDGVASDHLQVVVMDGNTVVFATAAVPGAAGALNGAARAISIPAGTLAPGKNYTGMIRHCRPVTVDSFTYPLATGMWSLARVTRFPMLTASGTSPRPMLQLPALVGTQTELTFSSVRGEKYVIHTAAELPVWTAGPAVTATGPSTVFRLPPSAAASGFYRVMIAP